jgi:hypothetical protein
MIPFDSLNIIDVGFNQNCSTHSASIKAIRFAPFDESPVPVPHLILELVEIALNIHKRYETRAVARPKRQRERTFLCPTRIILCRRKYVQFHRQQRQQQQHER